MSDRNAAALLRAALKHAADRWQLIGPTILYDQDVNSRTGLAAAEVNGLAAEAGLGGPIYTEETTEEDGLRHRWLLIHRPDSDVAMRWNSWSSAFPARYFDLDPTNRLRLRPDLLRDTLAALHEWLSLCGPKEPQRLSRVVSQIVGECQQRFLGAHVPAQERRTELALLLTAAVAEAKRGLLRAHLTLKEAVDFTLAVQNKAGLLVASELDELRRTGRLHQVIEEAVGAAGYVDYLLATAADANMSPHVNAGPARKGTVEAPPGTFSDAVTVSFDPRGRAPLSEIDFSYLPRLSADGLPAHSALKSAQQYLCACLKRTPLADASGEDGCEQLADALLSFWEALRAAVQGVVGERTAYRDRISDVHQLATHVAHPQAHAAEEVFQAAVGYSDAEGSRREKLDATVRQLRMTIGMWGSYGAASPEARWSACQRIIPEYTAALLAALDPDGPADEDTLTRKSPSRYLFARLPDGRYKIRFGAEDDVFNPLAGLRLIEYMLKQPDKGATLLEINRDLHSGKAGMGINNRARGGRSQDDGEEMGAADWEDVGASVDARCRKESSALDPETVERIKDEIADHEQLARDAESLGDYDEAADHRKKVEAGRLYLRDPRLFGTSKDAQEGIRTKLINNKKNAIKALRAARMKSAADYLNDTIACRKGVWTYRSRPDITWAFSEEK